MNRTTARVGWGDRSGKWRSPHPQAVQGPAGLGLAGQGMRSTFDRQPAPEAICKVLGERVMRRRTRQTVKKVAAS
jgi:hypothetical protein